MKKYVLLFFVSFLLSCSDNGPQIQRRDVIIKRYFQLVDSLPGVNADFNSFALLKAYHNNDTNSLKETNKELESAIKNSLRLSTTSCIDEKPLYKGNFEEAYRFEYDRAFCDKYLVITVGLRNDSIISDMKLYRKANDRDQTPCELVNHKTSQLTNSAWEELKKRIYYADFWGLKSVNKSEGFDGSHLVITGQKKISASKGEYHSAYRWAAEETAIGEVLKKCIELSGAPVDCLHF